MKSNMKKVLDLAVSEVKPRLFKVVVNGVLHSEHLNRESANAVKKKLICHPGPDRKFPEVKIVQSKKPLLA